MGDDSNAGSGHNSSRIASQLKAASKSTNEEIKEISNVLKSLAKTLNNLSEKNSEAGKALADLQEKNSDVRDSLAEIKQNNTEVLKHLNQHATQIAALQTENAKLGKQVKMLTEQVIQQDQYSRKDIVIMTGLHYDYEEDESSEELAQSVTNVLNRVTGNKLNLTDRDFVAIHRNRIDKSSDRPPTVTIKFLRYSDKDKLFDRAALSKRKEIFPHIKLHHGLCPGLIEERNKISAISGVKFVRYDGANRHFTVCFMKNGEPDRFFNRIRNFEHMQQTIKE